jgi:ABC-2 type transport system permease protein
MNFIIPGIIMMIVIQETFSNISETMITMKQHGTFKDIIMSPISRIEIAISYLIAVLFIGIVVACINLIVISFFVDFQFYNFFRFIFYLSLTSLLFGSIGSIIGFVSYTWDVQQGLFNFLIAPISLLSGTFFSIEMIEDHWKNIFLANPFYHLVFNLRKSFEINQIYNIQIDCLLIILTFSIVYLTLFLFKSGFRVIE